MQATCTLGTVSTIENAPITFWIAFIAYLCVIGIEEVVMCAFTFSILHNYIWEICARDALGG